MAVTFAVGAVTGTVLTLRVRSAVATFMGQWGEAFGIPFAFEGLFFFTEAIFIAIYIFGWRRLKPWAHFWTGVPVVLTGVLGSVVGRRRQRVDELAGGLHARSPGKVVDVDPLGVIFNDAMPLMAAHMVLAAYVVGGFLVASVYAVAMLRGRRDRYHRLGFLIAFSVAAIAIPDPDGRRRLAGPLGVREPADQVRRHRARARDVQRRTRDPARSPQLRRHRERRHHDPWTGVVAVRSERRYEHRRSRASTPFPPTSARRSGRSTRCTWRGTSWSGSARCCSCCRRGTGCVGSSGATCPRAGWFLWIASGAGVAAVITMEAGWVVSEVGRQPWIVYNLMKVEDAATDNTGVWITFILVTILYLGLGVTTVLILRR